MRKSISSEFARVRAGVAIGAAGLALSASPARTQDFVDDLALKQAFEKKLGAAVEAKQTTPAGTIHEQLRARRLSREPLPASLPGTSPLDHGEQYRRARGASLIFGHLYLCDDCDEWHGSLSGGVLLSPDGLALTNYHVLTPKDAVTFGAMTDSGEVFPVKEVLASHQKNDIALVRLAGAKDLPHVSLAEAAEVGEEIHLVSHPDSHFFTFSKGMVSRYYLDPRRKAPWLQITAPFARGSSGSGVLDSRGNLVGVVASTSSIYYKQNNRRQTDLQMVVHSCVPLSSIRDLFEENGKDSPDPSEAETLTSDPPPVAPTRSPASDRAGNADGARPRP